MPLRCAGAAGVQEKIPPHCCGGIFESAIEESTLGELGSATGGLEAVFHETEAQFCLILRGFSSFLLFVHQFLNPQFCGLLSDFNPNLFLMCRLLC